MKLLQFTWTKDQGWMGERIAETYPDYHLVLVFGNRSLLSDPSHMEEIRRMFPNADTLAASGAGEISGTSVLEEGISLTALRFEKSRIRCHEVSLSEKMSRRDAAIEVANALAGDDLRLIFVLADGQNVNGSELVSGFNSVFRGTVPVVGGLAGDGSKFEETLVGLNKAPVPGQVAAVGLYGDDLLIGFGSRGGWLPFGPERLVTKSNKNVLFELDGKSALSLYKSYLGERANELPASALLFPLSIKTPGSPFSTVRTILSVDEAANSMTFAGDVPVGSTVQLMKAGFERLIEGANEAVDECMESGDANPQLAILVSCVGRRLIMGPRVDEEVELIQERFKDALICGFYSYGELSPALPNGYCELHNQTMTITTIREK